MNEIEKNNSAASAALILLYKLKNCGGVVGSRQIGNPNNVESVMSIMPPISQRESNRANTALNLDVLIKIVEGGSPYDDVEHERLVLFRFYETTQTAANSSDPFCERYRKEYFDALGKEGAEEFLIVFNDGVKAFVEAVRSGDKETKLFPNPTHKEKVLAGLRALLEKTHIGGFIYPHPGMDLSPRSGPCF